ncbi:7100_t:CDS:10 [Paraglomus brasilianum]|uniref:Spindle pole body component n=1 Tax=Paraglomus brasilianum TaxID=144538 RepID=A0A9N9ALE5_9GLOM|nr:7100_t:CDS:10 [Paraglomus brasilianum]
MSANNFNSTYSNDGKQSAIIDKSWLWRDLDNDHSEFITTKRQCIDLVKELKSRQYWTSSYKGSIRLNHSSRFDFSNANTFAPSLAKIKNEDPRYEFYDATRTRYISEIDAVREVLFMLSTRPSFLFRLVKEEYRVEINATLMHLTELAFKEMLEYFCKYGNILSRLRGVSMRICLEHCSLYGQTAQAFAYSVLKMLWCFEGKLANLESAYQKPKDDDVQVSLLCLKQQLMNDFIEFEIVHEIVISSHLSDVSPYHLTSLEDTRDNSLNTHTKPSLVTYSLLNRLFREVTHHQICGNKSTRTMLEKHLYNTLVPYVRMIDDWICNGILNDPADEFFIVGNSTIEKTSSNYWAEMFKVRTINVVENGIDSTQSLMPEFLNAFYERILFSGKGRNLLITLNSNEAGPSTPLVLGPNVVSDLTTFHPFNERFAEQFKSYLEPRYMHIGKCIYNTLVERCSLWRHIRALSGLYLLQEGDTMRKLCDVIFERIDRNQMWYDSYVFNDMVSGIFAGAKWLDSDLVSAWIDDVAGKKPDITTVKVFEKITIEYRVPWPLDNIIQSRTLQIYKKIFALLLQIKRVKFFMERLAFSRMGAGEEKTSAMMMFYGLRTKLIWFLNVIWDYLMRTAKTQKFHEDLTTAFDIDKMIMLHEKYTQRIHSRCLLTQKTSSIHKSVFSILNLTFQFSTLYNRYMETNTIPCESPSDNRHEEKELANDVDNYVPKEVNHEEFVEGLQRIRREFDRHRDFIATLVGGIGRAGGFWWFDALSLALRA